MLKKVYLVSIALLILLSVILSGCGDAIKSDLQSFSSDVGTVSDLFDTVSAEMKANGEEKVAQTLKESAIPKLEQEIKVLNGKSIKSQEVKDLNKNLIDVINSYIETYKLLADAANTQDEALLNKANEKAKQSEKLMDDFGNKYMDLASKHGLSTSK